MKKVWLVGIDCSTCSDRALKYASDWAAAANIRLIVVHVIAWSPFSFQTQQENEERHRRREAELERAHLEIVDPVVRALVDRGIDAEGVIRHGHPAETLCEVAEERDATHILVGKTGSSRIRAQLFGSVPNSLIQISAQPVTVVP
jgi:nucleotide-binding universal stress UspA family protein